MARGLGRGSLWRNREYMLLWGGQSISSIGSRVSGIVFPLLVLDLTHSAAQAGLVGALFALPYALFGLPAGVLVDRWNRKRVMLICDTIRALNIVSMPIAIALGRLSVGQIFAVAVIEGSSFTFYDVAQGASLPRLVTPEQLPAALARSAGMVGIAGLLGPPIGGALYQVKRALPFIVDTVSYSASVVSLLFIRTELQEERFGGDGARAGQGRTGLRREMVEGLRWIRGQPLIRFTGIMAANNGMVGTGASLAIILLARQQHASASTIGLMFAIAAVGGTAGSFITSPLVKRFTTRQILIAPLWIEALLFPLYLVISAPLLLGVVTGAIWLISGPYHLATGTYRRALVPDALQGRVGSVFELAELGADSIGYAVCGVLLQGIGVQRTLVVLLGWLVAQALISTLNPQVRHAPALVREM